MKLANNLGTLKDQLIALAEEGSPLLASNRTIDHAKKAAILPPSSIAQTRPKTFSKQSTPIPVRTNLPSNTLKNEATTAYAENDDPE
jgi:hypothetical protein